tara:strand:- start:3488 stop:4474 length:987 start_codon:yes stop_codon:yes gene_type:complete
MNYRKFSDLGWNVSEIGLGCWQLGWGWGEVISNNNAKEILKKTLDKGINFFDTSDTYGDGRSEKFLSEMIKSTSERLYVSTKLGRRVRGTNYAKGYKQEPMEEFVDRSLLNLGVESIDLLQLHCPPSDVILKKETYEMMDKIVKKGKIMHYGVSVWTVSDALEAIKNPSVKSIQLVFNIFRQKPAEVFFNEAKKKNVAVIARGPLASGLLTGKINKKTKFAENDHRNYNINGKAFDIGDTFSGVNLNTGLEAVEELKNLVPKNHTLTTLALKWILSHEAVSVVIPGAANKLQAEMNASTSELEDISDIIPKINAIYERFIKPDYHDRW